MPLTLTIGDTSLPIDTLADLTALVTRNGASGTVFGLALATLGDGTQPIGKFEALDKDISLSYQSNSQTWNLDGGVFTFGISGGVTGTLHVYSPGKTLFSYTNSLPVLNGFDAASGDGGTANFSVPGANFFVGITLQLTLDVNLAGAGTVSFVGIKGSAEASGTYTFSFFKQVLPATSITDALKSAFASFTLPLHDRTFANLSVGDSILHNFKADLKLGMGLSYGIQTPSVAQSISAALPTAVQGLPAANVAVDPSAGANVSLTASFEYSGAFEAYLWKESDVLGHYHLYRSKTLDTSFGIDANASLISNASVTVDGGDVASAISGAIAGQTGQVIAQLVSQNTGIQASLDKAANDINTVLTNILKPIQGVQAELQASIETTNTKSLLFNLSLDLSKPGFDLAAWDSISEGDFVAAIEQDHSGITVDPGSGLEQLHHRKTDFKLTFANFTGEWSTTRIKDFSITYEGNHSYAFTDIAGLDEITTINNTGKEIQFYFTISVVADGAGNAIVPNPDFHVNLKSTSNPRFGAQLAKFLSLTATGAALQTVFEQMQSIAANPNAVIELDVVFRPTAYQLLQASPCPLHSPADEALDRATSKVFLEAVWNANGGVSNVPDFSYNNKLDMDYDFYALLRESQDDQFPPKPGALPNRRNGWLNANLGPVHQAISSRFGNVDPNVSVLMAYAMNVLQATLNLVQDTGSIGVPPAQGAGNPLAVAQQARKSLNVQVGYILKNDVEGGYLLPTACTLATLAIGAGAKVVYTGPVLPTAQDPGYKLTVELS